ncbi:hypothetical protein ASE08_24105 [Rhizobacter sp. Root16D2]|nr:hypothetical protein ASC88_23805 [Rhizobacter sp. Root29]KQW06081.1 hypothetical protein ASC98_26195 [Rhizobacter sp. Root1238]KRB19440.1 hypothetical protein ASE08_24105 [Rhizobacter sp. Root16D2]
MIALGALAFAAAAATAAIPYTFSAGTAIKSAEVNGNFSALQGQADGQDGRLTKLETQVDAQDGRLTKLEVAIAKPTDQLICVTASTVAAWVRALPGAPPANCVQGSAPTDTKQMTFAQVMQEGWLMVTVDGGGGYALFHK